MKERQRSSGRRRLRSGARFFMRRVGRPTTRLCGVIAGMRTPPRGVIQSVAGIPMRVQFAHAMPISPVFPGFAGHAAKNNGRLDPQLQSVNRGSSIHG